MLKNFNKVEDATSLVTDLTDPLAGFEAAHAPANLSTVEAANQIEVKNGR